MTDLSLASFEEINAELTRRYRGHIIAVIHNVEGHPSASATRVQINHPGNDKIHSMGIAQLILRVAEAQALGGFQFLPNDHPLDGGPLKPPQDPFHSG